MVEAIATRLGRRHAVTVYCNSRYTTPDAHVPGVVLQRIGTLPGKHIRPLSYFVASAVHALAAGRYDVVHIHNAEACFVAPLLKTRYPLLATSHGTAYRCGKWGSLASRLIRMADLAFIRSPDALTCVSQPQSRAYEQQWGRPVEYIPNGVDTTLPVDRAAASAELGRYGLEGHRSYCLFVAGRLDPIKGCHTLLEVFSQLEGDHSLVVVGDARTHPTYVTQLRHMADRRVRFVPFIADRATLFGIVARARLFVFPSTVEAMSMALLEAASLGVPIVYSDIPENRVVMDGCGLSFRAGDAAALAAQLRRALAEPEQMAGLARAAQVRMREQFSWDVIAARYEAVYERVLAARRHEEQIR